MGEAYGYRKAELQVAAASKQAKPSDKRDSEFASLQSQIDTLTKAVQNLTASKTDESTKQNRRTDRFAYSRQQATYPPSGNKQSSAGNQPTSLRQQTIFVSIVIRQIILNVIATGTDKELAVPISHVSCVTKLVIQRLIVRDFRETEQSRGTHQARSFGRTDIGARCRSRSPSRSFINTVQSEHFQTSDDEMQCSTSNMETRNKFIYLPVQILNLKIAALVDTGSSINVISQQLFNSIPETHKSWVNSTSEKIVLANNQSVNIIGVSRIKIQIPQGKHWILVHVFSQTSHPLLLGTDYLVSKKIMLDFSKLTVCSRFCKVKNQKRLSVLPNSEMIVWGKVHNDILHGMQGICTNHSYLFKLGVLTAKSVVSVNKDKLVPVKLFNSTNEIVDIPRGQIVAKFEILANDSDLIATCIGNRENPEVNNVQFSTEKCEKTPEAPFQVWQMDLYGPVPVSAKGNSYIFAAVDAFHKIFSCRPIPNKDALTVAEVLFKLVSQYGVCDPLISDRGSEATARAIKEVCRLLEINQQYTPSFTHHCLGLCERTHRSFAERMTPYIQQGKHWEDMVPSILFSLNSTANDSVKYSPFEILYGSRPKFLLSGHVRDLNLASIPKDYHDYLKQFSERLDIIRNEVKDHALKSQTAMMERANQKVHNLTLRLGDFVYMSKDPTGPGHKFKFKFAGPYVVENCESPHLYTLKDQTTSKIFPSIHINRLKPAYVRKPNQCNYFMDPVITNVNQFTVEHDLLSDEHSEHSENDSPCNDLVSSENKLSNVPDVSTSENNLPVRRSKRTHRKPMRFRDTNFTTPESSTDSHIKKTMLKSNVY
ncbi:Hypothetical predicted protein [Mytilus galloprovincialis]|uniref:Integrase catalytic domain-containing protein n=1 Tax=Mytilus galloprovincialis TaxID=29158 RepID=A0A8B6CBU3_MYTGA|nr:Hypothetical predicted protein [Mytilus galloprovincialis]